MTSIALFLDLNETLIRTGEVSPELRLREARHLTDFVNLCQELAHRAQPLELVFMTGNSFEYSRRIEEPLGLKNLPGVNLSVVSENGLLARSFQRGDLWEFEPTPAYSEAIGKFLMRLRYHSNLKGAYYTQGNEIRTTIKPVKNKFTDEQLRLLQGLADSILVDKVARTYSHPYYFDIDPAQVRSKNGPVDFRGKYTATLRLAQEFRCSGVLAIGDSASDLPMFKAVLELGGEAFWVANARKDEDVDGVQTVNGEFTAGVNEVLERVLLGSSGQRTVGEPLT